VPCCLGTALSVDRLKASENEAFLYHTKSPYLHFLGVWPLFGQTSVNEAFCAQKPHSSPITHGLTTLIEIWPFYRIIANRVKTYHNVCVRVSGFSKKLKTKLTNLLVSFTVSWPLSASQLWVLHERAAYLFSQLWNLGRSLAA
jgi:hypothetical protein